MVNFVVFEEFTKATQELYAQAPFRTRYVAKYRHCDGKLVLKVSDGPKTLKFKTDKLQDLNKFDRINKSLMALMQQNPIDLHKIELERQEQAQRAASGTVAGGSGGAGASAGAGKGKKGSGQAKSRK